MSTDQPIPSVARDAAKGWGRVMAKWFEASAVAWLSLGVSITVPMVAVVYNYAHLNGQQAALNYQITRNREEANDKIAVTNVRIDNMYTNLNAIYSMRTDIEVIKTQMQQVNDTVKRIENAQRRGAAGR